MEYKVEEIKFKSSNGKNTIHAKILSPIDARKIKGIVQFCHGMCEYFDKYFEFYKFLLENGYVVCGHDAIGHGDSIKYESERGFFDERDGYKYLIEDVKKMTTKVRKRYPYEPLFLLGHSMGSLIARCYAAKYGDELTGLLLCGTVGPQPLINSAINLANLIISRKGERYRSRKLNSMFFDFANLGFDASKCKYDWATSDTEAAKKMEEDPKQDFIFTASGFRDLFKLVKIANSDKVIKTVPKNLPILFFSGDQDPVGEKGIGVKRAVKLYKNEKIKEITCKLYKDCRHEMLRERNKKQVYKDILDWIELVRFGEE